jgi:phosphoribosyl-ATP pyrophosphohydrolase
MLGLQIGQEIEYKVKEYNAKRQPIIKHGVVRHITNRMLVIQLDQYRDTIQVADLISGQVELVKPAMPDGLVLVNRIKRDDPKRPSNTKGLYVIDHLAEKRRRKRFVARKGIGLTRQEQIFKDLWEDPRKTNAEIAEKLGVKPWKLQEWAHEMGLPRGACGIKPQELTPQKEEKLVAKERYDWDKLLPEAVEMASKGMAWATIAERLDVPYGSLYRHLRAADISQRRTKAPEPPEEICQVLPTSMSVASEAPEPDIKCPEENVYTARINARLSAQIAKGMAKYGQPLEHNLASQSERLEHLAQELTDGLMYIEWIRDHGNHGGPLFGLPDVDWQSHGWTIPGQIKKVFEEAGEVAEAIAEQRPMEVVREALDTIQTCKTLISMVLARETRIDIDELLDSHRAKLTRKGYIREEK